jgi:hypothetical protein
MESMLQQIIAEAVRLGLGTGHLEWPEGVTYQHGYYLECESTNKPSRALSEQFLIERAEKALASFSEFYQGEFRQTNPNWFWSPDGSLD